jgi:hypothetical protein
VSREIINANYKTTVFYFKNVVLCLNNKINDFKFYICNA